MHGAGIWRASGAAIFTVAVAPRAASAGAKASSTVSRATDSGVAVAAQSAIGEVSATNAASARSVRRMGCFMSRYPFSTTDSVLRIEIGSTESFPVGLIDGALKRIRCHDGRSN
jgi:hypothetical protein